ncbi:MAG: cation:proton antiporter domain-containing protein [Acidimicrobiales bacterium]
MNDTASFALAILLAAATALSAVLSQRLTSWLKIPAPALFLAGAAVAVKIIPGLRPPAQQTLQQVVTVALVLVLFDGGMHLGWTRLRSNAVAVGAAGLLGTFATAFAGAVVVHLAFGLSWYLALLVATAVAPTDPAVVFSVLGRREVSGPPGIILKGESGANDPVGIALMASLVTAGSLTSHALGHAGIDLAVQMLVGAGTGIIGGRLLVWSMRHVQLPSEGLYPLRALAGALLLFGLATVAHGSGFLAVFVAGIVLGDERAPFKREIERFHSALASLGEIAAFIVLGLGINIANLVHTDVFIPGIVLAATLTLVIRPVLVGLLLLPARLEAAQRRFVLFAGLKGAVPLLLGSFLITAHVPGAERLDGIVAIVVVLSVTLQGSLAPAVARALSLPTRVVEPEPWGLGVRLKEEPEDLQRLTVMAGSPADNCAIADLKELPGDAWISLLVRNGRLLPVRGATRLTAGDEVIVLGGPGLRQQLEAAFEKPAHA